MTTDDMLWPVDVWVGDVVYPPGGALGPRVQPTVELVLLHSGEMAVWVDDVRRDAPAGTVCILFPGHVERFAFAAHTQTRHSFVHIDISALPAELERTLPWKLPLSPRMNDLMQQALALRQSSLSTRQTMLKALGTLMLWCYIGEAEGEQVGSAAQALHPAVERARQYIRSHLHEPLTLDAIANAAVVSPSHLIRLFQTQLNTTPVAYVWEERVVQGVELLENTGLPVGIIAEQCGFQTSDHFSRRVRAATGLAPLDVRKRAWKR
jgi:AraC family transcriptional regulator of arabinose operon